MSDEQRMVTEFNRAFDIVIGTSPAMPDAATCALRVSLIQEEFDELREALAQQDVEAVAKELADLLYVVYGTAVSCGMDMAPVFQEVHRSNMSKVGGHKRADGKWLKPPDYSPARLQHILAAQSTLEYQDAAVHTQHGDMLGYSTTVQAGTLAPAPTSPPQVERATFPPPAGDGPPSAVHVELLPLSEDSREASRTREGDRRMHGSLTVQCPRCGQSFVRRAHRQGLKERLLSLVYVYPYRCQVCAHRFRAFRSRVHYAKHAVDRRPYARLSTQLPTTFAAAVKPGEQQIGQGIVTELSLSGCYLQTVVRLCEGTLLSLELQTAQSTPAIAVAVAIVRTVRPTGVGLEFLRLRESEQARFNQFIHQLRIEEHVTEDEDR